MENNLVIKYVKESRIVFFPNLLSNIHQSNLEQSLIHRNFILKLCYFFLLQKIEEETNWRKNIREQNPHAKKALEFTKKLFKLDSFCIFLQTKIIKVENQFFSHKKHPLKPL